MFLKIPNDHHHKSFRQLLLNQGHHRNIHCNNALVHIHPFPYVPTLLFWKDNSRPPVSSWNFPFWHYPCLNVRSLWIFKSITIFTNSMWKSWQLEKKLGACVALGYHLIMSSRFVCKYVVSSVYVSRLIRM